MEKNHNPATIFMGEKMLGLLTRSLSESIIIPAARWTKTNGLLSFWSIVILCLSKQAFHLYAKSQPANRVFNYNYKASLDWFWSAPASCVFYKRVLFLYCKEGPRPSVRLKKMSIFGMKKWLSEVHLGKPIKHFQAFIEHGMRPLFRKWFVCRFL